MSSVHGGQRYTGGGTGKTSQFELEVGWQSGRRLDWRDQKWKCQDQLGGLGGLVAMF